MPRRILTGLCVFIGLGLTVSFLLRNPSAGPPRAPTFHAEPSDRGGHSGRSLAIPSNAPERPGPERPAQHALPAFAGVPPNPAADALHDPAGSGEADLRIVHSILESYRERFRAFPSGENREIVNALAGANPDGLPFLPRNHRTLNADGEWIDRWSTPLFFHHLASDVIEIRSAGPDRVLYSPDDLVHGSPRERREAVRR